MTNLHQSPADYKFQINELENVLRERIASYPDEADDYRARFAEDVRWLSKPRVEPAECKPFIPPKLKPQPTITTYLRQMKERGLSWGVIIAADSVGHFLADIGMMKPCGAENIGDETIVWLVMPRQHRCREITKWLNSKTSVSYRLDPCSLPGDDWTLGYWYDDGSPWMKFSDEPLVDLKSTEDK